MARAYFAMNETLEQSTKPENANVSPSPEKLKAMEPVYGEGDEGAAEAKYALGEIQKINDALARREENSMVFNGIPYSRAYLYNQSKAVNYAPPRQPKDDREVSMGIIHEKIIAFVALFIKYRFKRRIKCYDKDGKLIPGMGDFYDLAIEFSHRMEQFVKKVALIYWEVFTQGNAFIIEEWDVRTLSVPEAYNTAGEGEVKVDANNMDYTFEFLESLTYKPGEQFQTRKAVSRLADGREVIFDNPDIEEVQDQPGITLEDEIDRSTAEQLYGTLARWKSVPSEATNIDSITPDKISLFGTARLSKPSTKIIRHRRFDKANNRMNLYLNGVMMLPRQTPFTIFYPRNNYPITNIPGERLTGSIYARSIPAKTKFNADYLDWILKNLALKFEQGVIPAILAKGKYTLSRDIFRAGQVTHGVSKSDYEFANPDNKGVTNGDFSFANLIKEIVQTQTTSVLSAGDLSSNPTAEEVASLEQNQREKLAYILDGLMNGFMDMALRRAETIESKYTIKQKETVVDGKTISVYHNFNINLGGVNHSVIFDDQLSSQEYDHDEKRNELFMDAHKARKEGQPSETYIADPMAIRRGEYVLDIEIVPEKVKETDLAVQLLFSEIQAVTQTFGQGAANLDEYKKIFLEISGRPSAVFAAQDIMALQKLQQEAAAMAAQNGEGPTAGARPQPQPRQPKQPALMR